MFDNYFKDMFSFDGYVKLLNSVGRLEDQLKRQEGEMAELKTENQRLLGYLPKKH
jgi:hypothetical protein